MLVAFAAALPARAQDSGGLFSPDSWAVAGDVRVTAGDGEASWLDGGYGKTRFGGSEPDRGWRVEPRLVEGNLIWQPRFGWAVSGTLVATAQQGQEHPVDLSEAFLTWKPLVGGRVKPSVRAGLFWPPVSLEHSGPEWRVTETITPSAINSWIGDEVKLGGVEANLAVTLGGHRLTGSFALFGLNDTSGTLLAFRGWALHDEKVVAFGLQPLPPLTGFIHNIQAPETRPVIEIDNRFGWYGKLGWSPMRAFELQLFHYDNRGDPEAMTPTQQWGWRTRFTNIGALIDLGHIRLRAQAMGGRTEMGFVKNGRIWVDTDFHSAFLLMTRLFDRGSVSARVEAFDTNGRGSRLGSEGSEQGWALTAAARREIGPHLSLLGEVLHVESDRAARATIGLAPHQPQTLVQLGLRVHL